MNNREFFDYLKVLGKLPHIRHEEWYRIILNNEINIIDYYRVYSKIQPNIEYSAGMNRMIESIACLLGVVNSQEEFDKFVKKLDKIIKMWYNYSKSSKFIATIDSNYLRILRQSYLDRLSGYKMCLEDIMKAIRVIINPDNVLVGDKIYTCDCLDESPRSHFKLITRSGEKIDKVAMITYSNGSSHIHQIKSHGEYKECILSLKEMLKNDTMDFVVCSHRMKYGTIVPLLNVLFKDKV